jgi:hypothetical protein
VVGGDAIHVDGLLGDATKEIASSDDDANLATEGVNGGDFGGDFVDEDSVNAETLACSQGFSRDLEEDSFVHVRTKYRMGELEGFCLCEILAFH